MTFLRIIAIFEASILSLQAVGAVGDDGLTSTVHSAQRVDCLAPMNLARAEADLTAFKAATQEGSKLPVVDKDAPEEGIEKQSDPIVEKDNDEEAAEAAKNQAKFLNAFCPTILEQKTPSQGQNGEQGTYMYAPASSDASTSCTAAVQYWVEAKNSFTTVPPAYSASEPLYIDNRNISFVGLFNTGSDPTVDCAFITCKGSSASHDQGESGLPQNGSPPSASLNSDPKVEVVPGTESVEEKKLTEGSGSTRRLSEGPSVVYSLLCLSSPQALQNSKEPFTQEQWDKIKGVENGSTQPKLFAVLALVTATFLHSIF